MFNVSKINQVLFCNFGKDNVTLPKNKSNALTLKSKLLILVLKAYQQQTEKIDNQS